jgi:lipopolysaccharide/colanic/teichoic acid biosynthesis glycosyltransferase
MGIRFFDILLSGLALFLLSPILLTVVTVLSVTGERKIIFSQERVGKDKKFFRLLKFVTMLADSPNIGTGTITTKNDPRILPVGSILRKTKLNELPQLANVFLGNMSIIGPRPLAIGEYSLYSSQIQSIVSRVKPGLSGIGSIVFRNEEEIIQGHENAKEFYASQIAPYKGDLEEWYVSNVSMATFFILIFLTAWVVSFPKTKIVWKIFKTLPKPPISLSADLGYE